MKRYDSLLEHSEFGRTYSSRRGVKITKVEPMQSFSDQAGMYYDQRMVVLNNGAKIKVRRFDGGWGAYYFNPRGKREYYLHCDQGRTKKYRIEGGGMLTPVSPASYL